MKQRPFAVFDIDGTIIRWQLYHAIADELVRQGSINGNQYDKVKQARMAWKRRDSESSFQDYEETLVNLIEAAITSISVADLEKACKKVIEEYRDQVYRYTRDFIHELKAKDYLLFAISASQTEIVKLLAEYYEFDDYGGSIYEIKNGHFTGKKAVLRSERKPEYLHQLIKKHHATLEGSIGVGDSESDIPMLKVVDNPIAFNPAKQLYEHAKQHSWPIVIERKNVIYRLEDHGKGYQLQT